MRRFEEITMHVHSIDQDRLIASAPIMLKALQRITHPAADDVDVEFALDVIASITGERPVSPEL